MLENPEVLRKTADDFLNRATVTDVGLLASPSQIALTAVLNSASRAGLSMERWVLGGDAYFHCVIIFHGLKAVTLGMGYACSAKDTMANTLGKIGVPHTAPLIVTTSKMHCVTMWTLATEY